MSSTYDSIMAGTQVQEIKTRLRTVQETYERQLAEIVGAEATGQGWDAPGFELFKSLVKEMADSMELISDLAARRIAAKVQADVDKTA